LLLIASFVILILSSALARGLGRVGDWLHGINRIFCSGINLNIVVTSIDGSIISNTSATNNAIQTVDLNNLSKGLYFVKISSGSNSRTLKVTKM
jgi:hypothetical protein